jgi:hypothetical protein
MFVRSVKSGAVGTIVEVTLYSSVLFRRKLSIYKVT